MPLIHLVLSAAWLWMTVAYLWPAPFVQPWLLFAAFFLAGAVWMVAAILMTIERLRYGAITLDQAGPARSGGKLVAVARAPRGFAGARALRARLQCLRTYYLDDLGGNRKNLTYAEEVIWSLEREFPVTGEAGERECRISFDIPADAEASRTVIFDWSPAAIEWYKSGYRWQVGLRTDAPGIGLMRDFPITVAAPPAGKMKP